MSVSAHEAYLVTRRRLPNDPRPPAHPHRRARRRTRAPSPPPPPPPPERDDLLQRSLLAVLIAALAFYTCQHGCGRADGARASPAADAAPTFNPIFD